MGAFWSARHVFLFFPSRVAIRSSDLGGVGLALGIEGWVCPFSLLLLFRMCLGHVMSTRHILKRILAASSLVNPQRSRRIRSAARERSAWRPPEWRVMASPWRPAAAAGPTWSSHPAAVPAIFSPRWTCSWIRYSWSASLRVRSWFFRPVKRLQLPDLRRPRAPCSSSVPSWRAPALGRSRGCPAAPDGGPRPRHAPRRRR